MQRAGLEWLHRLCNEPNSACGQVLLYKRAICCLGQQPIAPSSCLRDSESVEKRSIDAGTLWLMIRSSSFFLLLLAFVAIVYFLVFVIAWRRGFRSPARSLSVVLWSMTAAACFASLTPRLPASLSSLRRRFITGVARSHS